MYTCTPGTGGRRQQEKKEVVCTKSFIFPSRNPVLSERVAKFSYNYDSFDWLVFGISCLAAAKKKEGASCLLAGGVAELSQAGDEVDD